MVPIVNVLVVVLMVVITSRRTVYPPMMYRFRSMANSRTAEACVSFLFLFSDPLLLIRTQVIGQPLREGGYLHQRLLSNVIGGIRSAREWVRLRHTVFVNTWSHKNMRAATPGGTVFEESLRLQSAVHCYKKLFILRLLNIR